MRNGHQALHKGFEIAEVTCLILRGILRAIRHEKLDALLLDWSMALWCPKVKA